MNTKLWKLGSCRVSLSIFLLISFSLLHLLKCIFELQWLPDRCIDSFPPLIDLLSSACKRDRKGLGEWHIGIPRCTNTKYFPCVAVDFLLFIDTWLCPMNISVVFSGICVCMFPLFIYNQPNVVLYFHCFLISVG